MVCTLPYCTLLCFNGLYFNVLYCFQRQPTVLSSSALILEEGRVNLELSLDRLRSGKEPNTPGQDRIKRTYSPGYLDKEETSSSGYQEIRGTHLPGYPEKKGASSLSYLEKKGTSSPGYLKKKGTSSPSYQEQRGTSSSDYLGKKGTSSPGYQEKRGTSSSVYLEKNGTSSPGYLDRIQGFLEDLPKPILKPVLWPYNSSETKHRNI